ncbi:hypothetical protein [Paenibacillus sp. KS-LC4]|uniref:hypothetical protein n=1 Tax=Paenibacillus sp. KS-LC4 TaxID=2979727 RepID=UPI0030D579CC
MYRANNISDRLNPDSDNCLAWFTFLNQKVCVKNGVKIQAAEKFWILEMMKSGKIFLMVTLSINFHQLSDRFCLSSDTIKRSFIQKNSLTKVALEEILM